MAVTVTVLSIWNRVYISKLLRATAETFSFVLCSPVSRRRRSSLSGNLGSGRRKSFFDCWKGEKNNKLRQNTQNRHNTTDKTGILMLSIKLD